MKLTKVAILAAMTLSGAAYAQHKHGHAHTEKGPNGGLMTEAGEYHVELVTKADVVDVYLADQQPID